MAAEDVTNTTTKKKSFKEPRPVCVARNAVDLQRMKLQKLMEHPVSMLDIKRNLHNALPQLEKPVVIPEGPKERILASPPEFNRNVMGSSAGAGSGEFHVYRHIRRREYARQKYISEKADKEKKNEEFRAKLEAHRQMAELKTAKKRTKRLKKKKNIKLKRLKAKESGAPKVDDSKPADNEDSDDDEDDDVDEQADEDNK